MNLSSGRETLGVLPEAFMTVRYTTYRLKKAGRPNKAGTIVESKVVTSAADVEAFERARAAVIADRQQMLSEVCMPVSAAMEDAA